MIPLPDLRDACALVGLVCLAAGVGLLVYAASGAALAGLGGALAVAGLVLLWIVLGSPPGPGGERQRSPGR